MKHDYLKKIHTESVVQQIINSLTEAIINQQFRPGDRLPTENELAAQLGVGRNSVREAIKILVYMGILEIRRPDGTFVCEGMSENMIDSMIYGIILDKEDSYENLIELQEMVETGVIKLVIKKQNSEKLLKLHEKLDHIKNEIEKGSSNMERIFQADNAFHNTIAEMGENPLVDKINHIVRVLTHSMRYQTVQNMLLEEKGDLLYQAHEKLYQLIEKKDESDLRQTVRDTYFVERKYESKETYRVNHDEEHT